MTIGHPVPTVIETERSEVVLRQIMQDDAGALFRLIDANREHLSHHGDDTAKKYPSLDSVMQSITDPLNSLRLRLGIWVFEQEGKKELAGAINLTTGGKNSAVVGYWLGEEYTGKGFATTACKALVGYVSRHRPFSQLVASTHAGNIASRRVLGRAGFSPSGFATGDDILFQYRVDPLAVIDQVVAELRKHNYAPGVYIPIEGGWPNYTMVTLVLDKGMVKAHPQSNMRLCEENYFLALGGAIKKASWRLERTHDVRRR